MQRFQGLDRHRPCGALPAGGWSTSFLPPFVGMTPLATDGPGSGSGAGFGRDHAEKWQSDRVSRTTSMVTKTTSLAGLDPAGTRTCIPSPHQIPFGAGPVVERGRRAVDLHPSRTGRAQQTEVDRVVGLLNNVPDPTTQGLKTCGSKPVSGRSIALIFQWSRPGRVSPGITHAPTSRAALRDLRTRPGPGGVGVLLLGGLQNIQDRLKSIWSVKSVTL